MTALHHIPGRTKHLPPLRVGIGGPVGSGKTTLLEMLCKAMRERWDDFMAAYEAVLNKTSTPWAPWHVVPADRKWFRDYAVAQTAARSLFVDEGGAIGGDTGRIIGAGMK